jgi:dUTP pyrophosphatase
MGLETELPCKKIKMPLNSVILRFAKLTNNAFSPTRGSKLAAGYDLYR